ncbi:ANKRD27, partial [Symbiodinium microadriaticum]
ATVNAGDMYGRSPLHLAVEHGHAAMAELLLERKADLEAKTADGKTPLDVAGEYNHPDVMKKIWNLRAGGRSLRGLFCYLVAAEFPEALEMLEDWPLPGKVGSQGSDKVRDLDRARLRERQRSVLAPAREEDTRMVVDTRDIDLLVQNLLPAAEVQACLKVLPGLYGADACKSDFLSSVAFATNDDALQTEAVAAMISVAWQQMRGTTALDIGLGFLTLAFLIYTSY